VDIHIYLTFLKYSRLCSRPLNDFSCLRLGFTPTPMCNDRLNVLSALLGQLWVAVNIPLAFTLTFILRFFNVTPSTHVTTVIDISPSKSLISAQPNGPIFETESSMFHWHLGSRHCALVRPCLIQAEIPLLWSLVFTCSNIKVMC